MLLFNILAKSEKNRPNRFLLQLLLKIWKETNNRLAYQQIGKKYFFVFVLLMLTECQKTGLIMCACVVLPQETCLNSVAHTQFLKLNKILLVCKHYNIFILTQPSYKLMVSIIIFMVQLYIKCSWFTTLFRPLYKMYNYNWKSIYTSEW